MTIYVHGRPERPRRSRRGLATVLGLALAGGALVGFAQTSGLWQDGPARDGLATTLAGAPGIAAVGAVGGDAGSTAAVEASSTAPAPALAPGSVPGLEGVDPELARRFVVARSEAAAQGVSLSVTSGRRTADEQQALVDDAVQRYGSLAEASRWVLPPETSAHVKGLALDVGGAEGAAWLEAHGAELGLCRTYANEAWHFELLPEGLTSCPEMAPDSSSGW